MTTQFGPDNGSCQVFTFKEGLLSPVAHDLRIDVGRWSVTWDGNSKTIAATFHADSLKVDTAMRSGAPAPSLLKPRDKEKIGKTIRDTVLNARRNPTVSFVSSSVAASDTAFAVTGTLTLNGRSKSIHANVVRNGNDLVCEVDLHQPDFGIKPYTAMLGALKVQAGVRVVLTVPAKGTS